MLNDPNSRNPKNYNSRPSANFSESPQGRNVKHGVMLPLQKDQAFSNNTTTSNQMSLMKGKKMTLINPMTDTGRE